jgi:hypothetical protein
MLESYFILALALGTSLAAAGVGLWRGGLSLRALPAAAGSALACLGLAAGCFVLNLLLGMGIALAARTLGSTFVSLYLANDVALLGLSLLQAITLQAWRTASADRAQAPAS